MKKSSITGPGSSPKQQATKPRNSAAQPTIETTGQVNVAATCLGVGSAESMLPSTRFMHIAYYAIWQDTMPGCKDDDTWIQYGSSTCLPNPTSEFRVHSWIDSGTRLSQWLNARIQRRSACGAGVHRPEENEP